MEITINFDEKFIKSICKDIITDFYWPDSKSEQTAIKILQNDPKFLQWVKRKLEKSSKSYRYHIADDVYSCDDRSIQKFVRGAIAQLKKPA